MSLVFPVPEDTRERIYTASEGQTVFNVPFPFQNDEDLAIAVLAHDADEDADYTGLTDSDFSVSGAGSDSGGSITLNVGRTENDKVRVRGAAVMERLTSIVRAGKYDAAALDADLDRLMIISQELARAVSGVEVAQAVAGGGDMVKATYDTNNDGKVDAAEVADAVPWSGITGVPATFAPASHTHTASDVTDLEAVATSGSMADMAEAADAKILTAAERAKIGFVSVTQSVDLDQMETDIAALSDGMTYNGDWDASAGTFPAGANQGSFYYVSVAGTVDSIEFAVGDNLVAIVDSASATVYAANWSKHDQTDAVSAVVGLTGSVSKSALLAALNVEEDADVTDAANVAAAGAVMNTGAETVAGVKTFSSDPIIPDEVYGAGWNGKLEPPTKNAVYDKIEALGGGGGSSIAVEDEGSGLTSAVTKFNFVGAGVTATESSNEVTVTVAGGAAPVDSVNGQTGAVVLDPDDLDDASTTHKFATAAELTKIGFLSVTQSVDLDQMETDIAALSDGMTYNGDWDASAGTFPAGANKGGFYYVSVAGTVDSIEFAVGDNLVAIVDSASATVYAANWSKHDQTDAVSAVVGLTGSVSKSALLAALNVEEDADVTDAANVAAAGALMDSELASIASVKALNQGVATDDSPTFVQPTVKAVIETRFAVTGTTPAIDPANGGIQTWTLSGNSTPTDALGDGESVTLHIDDGSARTITWSSLVDEWIGGSAPTLPTSGYAVVEVWKVNTTVYAAYLGDLS